MARILISPLSWGLGHATRDIPLIDALRARGHEVTVVATGRALALLKSEYPDMACHDIPDYPAPYSASRFFLPKFVVNVPVLLKAMAAERRAVRAFLAARPKFDLIVSDARFGVYDPDVPSYFIAHQLRYCLPGALRVFEGRTAAYNAVHHRNFTGVIVPDNPPGTTHLSGRLSLSPIPETTARVHWAGILASVRRVDVPQDLDLLVSISGPEPQRTRLEEILLPQLAGIPGKKVVLLGRPDHPGHRFGLDGTTDVRAHASRAEMAVLMSRAKVVVTRSGYTTMMELAELGKRRALFIPTPGQTEQEYLSEHYAEQGWFPSVSQYALNLERDLARTARFAGFPPMPTTAENAARLVDGLFAPHLGGPARVDGPPVHLAR